jgi:raffinose/stachyose/melibiose transport system substrate-binding protein
MAKTQFRNLSRRDFLKFAGTGLAAAGLGPLIASCAPQAPAEATQAIGPELPTGQELNWWWWGEQEAPGFEAWIKDSTRLYEEKTGNTIIPTLQDTDVVVSQFQTASAAGDAPDIQFFWNGSYCLESAWLGYVEPLDDLIPADILKDSHATILSIYDGKQYRIGFYGLPMLWNYGKVVFDKAGLNADEPPKTWDELLSACEKLKSAGFTPISAGLRDGFWGEWWLGQTLVHDLSSAGEAIDLFIGNLDWREQKYQEHWAKLKQLFDAGFINEDMLSIDLYPGIEVYMSGNSGMTSTVGGMVPESLRLLGDDGVGLMVFPYGGQGDWAGLRPIADTQGWGISSQSKNKEVAADFLIFLQSEERLNAIWDGPRQFPANLNWDGNQIDNPTMKQLWSGWLKVDHLPWIADLMPVMFWSEAMFVNAQKIIAGEWDAEQCAENSYQVTQKWKTQNPDMVEKYAIWKGDLSG